MRATLLGSRMIAQHKQASEHLLHHAAGARAWPHPHTQRSLFCIRVRGAQPHVQVWENTQDVCLPTQLRNQHCYKKASSNSNLRTALLGFFISKQVSSGLFTRNVHDANRPSQYKEGDREMPAEGTSHCHPNPLTLHACACLQTHPHPKESSVSFRDI